MKFSKCGFWQVSNPSESTSIFWWAFCLFLIDSELWFWKLSQGVRLNTVWCKPVLAGKHFPFKFSYHSLKSLGCFSPSASPLYSQTYSSVMNFAQTGCTGIRRHGFNCSHQAHVCSHVGISAHCCHDIWAIHRHSFLYTTRCDIRNDSFYCKITTVP